MATIVTNDDFVNACNWLISQGQLNFVGERHIDRNTRKVYDAIPDPLAPPENPNKQILNDITPDQLTLEAALDNALLDIASEQTVETSQSGLRDKIALAHDPTFAPVIKDLFNAVLDQTSNRIVQPARFNNIKAVIDAAPASFQNRFNDDLLAEADLDIVLILPTITASQRAWYCQYARLWVTGLALLLSQPL